MNMHFVINILMNYFFILSNIVLNDDSNSIMIIIIIKHLQPAQEATL